MFLGVLDRFGTLSGMSLRIDVLFFFSALFLYSFLFFGFLGFFVEFGWSVSWDIAEICSGKLGKCILLM